MRKKKTLTSNVPFDPPFWQPPDEPLPDDDYPPFFSIESHRLHEYPFGQIVRELGGKVLFHAIEDHRLSQPLAALIKAAALQYLAPEFAAAFVFDVNRCTTPESDPERPTPTSVAPKTRRDPA